MSADTSHKPRIGIPYRTRKEELSGDRGKYDRYIQAVRRAGAEPVEISLGLASDELKKLAQTLDAVVLTGSPADVEPSLYHSGRNPKLFPDSEQARFFSTLGRSGWPDSQSISILRHKLGDVDQLGRW